jgi:hypothetical protein
MVGLGYSSIPVGPLRNIKHLSLRNKPDQSQRGLTEAVYEVDRIE